MSWTKKQFVDQSLEEIGIASYEYDLQPEQEQSVLRRLDSMMAVLNIKGVRIGYPLPSTQESSDLNQDTNVPDWANEGIYQNLAIKIAPMFGKIASPELKVSAKDSLSLIMSKAGEPHLQRALPSCPLGAGNKPWRMNRQFTTESVDPLTTGDDGVIEL